MVKRIEETESVEFKIIKSLSKAEDLTALEMDFLNEKISEIILSNKELSVKRIEAQKKYGQIKYIKKAFDIADHVIGYFSPAFQSILGFAIFPENPVAGGFLIASSAVTFVTKLLQDTKLINKVTDQFIKSEKDRDLLNKFIEGGTTATSITLSSITILINPLGTIEIFENVINIKKVADAALQGAKTTNSVLNNLTQYEVTKYEKKMTLIDMEKFKNTQKFHEVTNETKNASESQKRINTLVFQSFNINLK